MKFKVIILTSLFVLMGVASRAQQFQSDIQEQNLKGSVKSVLTTVRTPQGRIVGQPVRNNYNLDGYFEQNTYYDTLGNPVIIVHYSYDKKNRLVKDVRTHEPYSNMLSQTTYLYDRKARTITAEMFGVSDSLGEYSIYSFDKNNVLQSLTTFDEDGKELAATKYEYNDYGMMVYATYTEGANHIYKGSEKYRYDTDGNIAEKCSYYLTTLRQAFLYTYYYDEHGNWTQAFVFHVTPSSGYLYQVINRQIAYYE